MYSSAQVASTVLEVPISSIHIMETNTSIIPNSTATAASTGSDMWGMAIKVRQTNTILQPALDVFSDLNLLKLEQ